MQNLKFKDGHGGSSPLPRNDRALTPAGPIISFILLSSLISTIFSAALPLNTLDSWSAAIAESLNSDHVTFEPSSVEPRVESNDNGHLLTRGLYEPNYNDLDDNQATGDASPPDPHEWELVCSPPDGTDFMTLTHTCRTQYRFSCDEDGKLQHRKENEVCQNLCGCFQWTEEEGKPPTVNDLRASPSDISADAADLLDISGPTIANLKPEDSKGVERRGQMPASENDNILVPRHDYALICSSYDRLGQASENRTLTRSCMRIPWSYSCDGRGALISQGHDDDCEQACECENMNPRPKPLNWFVGQIPKSSSWFLKPRAGDDSDPEEQPPQLVKRHDYAIVCSDRAGESRDWTEICIGNPYKYRCSNAGKMSFTEKYDECSNKCTCHYMNPHPKPLNWAIGQVPKGGSWGKRGEVVDQVASPDDKAVAAVDLMEAWPREDPFVDYVDYRLVCFQNDRPDRELTVSCANFDPWHYWCDLEGNVTNWEPRDDCQRQCHCVAQNPSPIVLNWPAAYARVQQTLVQDELEESDTEMAVVAQVEEIDAQILDSEDRHATVNTPPGKQLLARHDYAMICYPNNEPSRAWTQVCSGMPWQYSCTGDGTLEYRRKYDQCDRLCECTRVNPVPYFKPGTYPVSPPKEKRNEVEVAGDSTSQTEWRAREKRHDYALVCRIKWEGEWNEDTTITRFCMASPYRYSCDSGGEISCLESNSNCNVKCICKNINPRPKPLNWLINQVPKSGGWARRQDEVSALEVAAISKRSVLEKRHDYAVVCRIYYRREWIEDLTTTQMCMSEPLKYTCNGLGQLIKVTNNQNCNERCICKNINPKPAPLNWLVGQMPKSGSWGRRDIDDSLASTSAEATETDTVQQDHILEKRDHIEKRHDFALICKTNGEDDAAKTRRCTSIPFQYTCGGGGQIGRRGRSPECEASCFCHYMNPRPHILNWLDGQTPKSGSWGRTVDTGSAQLVETHEQQEDDPHRRVEKRDRIEKRHDFALICRTIDEDAEHTRYCMNLPYSYSCNSIGQVTYRQRTVVCELECGCRNMNPKPRILNWAAGQSPKSGSWGQARALENGAVDVDQTTQELDASLEKRDDLLGPSVGNNIRAGSTSRPQTLSKRHDYALICELDGKRDSTITKSCSTSPRLYSCDSYGGLTKAKYDSYCDQHCACQNMNPKPFIMNAKQGSIPNPCVFCRRDEDARVVQGEEQRTIDAGPAAQTQLPDIPEATVATEDPAEPTTSKLDQVWVLDCNYGDGSQDLSLVYHCAADLGVICDAKGGLLSQQGHVPEQCADRCFCSLRPV